MSIKVMAWIWEHADADGTALLLLLALADFADHDGHAFPALATLASRCRTSKRHVARLLADLEAAGQLRRVRGGHGKGNRTTYALLPDEGDVEVTLTTGTKGDSGATSRVTRPSPPTVTSPRSRLPPHPERSTVTVNEPPPRWSVVVDEYQRLYGGAPTPQKRAFLVNLEDRFSSERAVVALRAEHANDPNPRTICGRMERGLMEGDKRDIAA